MDLFLLLYNNFFLKITEIQNTITLSKENNNKQLSRFDEYFRRFYMSYIRCSVDHTPQTWALC